jgi:CRISPR-associated protein Cas2
LSFVDLSAYRLMWLFVMFDLPVDTKLARRHYAQFRKFLLRDGFTQVQYSVYARVCASEDTMQVHGHRVAARVPPDGEVRLLCITDKQFERQKIFWGKLRKQPPKTPLQLEFF